MNKIGQTAPHTYNTQNTTLVMVGHESGQLSQLTQKAPFPEQGHYVLPYHLEMSKMVTF